MWDRMARGYLIKQLELIREERTEKNNSMKAAIIRIGRIENGSPVNWSFDSYTNIPALSASGRGILYYGYTVSELEEIMKTYQ